MNSAISATKPRLSPEGLYTVFQHPDFVYIHFPKSGGSSIRRIFEDYFSVERDRRYTHVPAYHLQDIIAGRRVLGSVRDPFAWYESRMNYPHFRRRPLPFLGEHDLDFIDMSRFILGMADQKFLLAHEDVVWRKEEYNIRPFRIMKRKGIGFLTFEFLFTYCRDVSLLDNDSAYLDINPDTDLVVDRWILTENIAAPLLDVLSGYDLPEQKQSREQVTNEIKGFRKVNSRPSDLVQKVSGEEADIIKHLDGKIIDFHKRLSDTLVTGSKPDA